jgi:NADPH-dependent F420 reductase
VAAIEKTIAVLGGTGDQGLGLGLRWAKAGAAVIVGSRAADRAASAAADINARTGTDRARGMVNAAAAAATDIVVLTVPFASQRATLEDVKAALPGKILVDVTVPLVPPRVGTVQLPPEGSAAKIAQAIVGPEVKVVSAFQNVSAHGLQDLAHDIACDVLVTGDDAEARETVVVLAEAIGLRAFHAGPLANAAAAEALTSILISINRRYKVPGSGIQITGVPRPGAS